MIGSWLTSGESTKAGVVANSSSLSHEGQAKMNGLKRIKDRLAAKLPVFGTSITLTDSCATEQMGLAGYDFVWIDMEHTALDKKEVMQNIIAAKAGGAASFVRVAWHDPVLIKPVLDMGPDGIIVPYVRNLEDAELAIRACRYPPRGIRGFGPIRASGYGSCDSMEYIENGEDRLLKMIQIEHIGAVDCLEEIVNIEGLDVIIAGPMDLSGSLGKLGRLSDPDVVRAMDRIGDVARKSGIPLGVSLNYTPADVKGWIARGATVISLSSDAAFLGNAAKETLRAARDLFSTRKAGPASPERT
jgi:2-keto-3-deoxy-L-rhamnonate aldolase RhmA